MKAAGRRARAKNNSGSYAIIIIGNKELSGSAAACEHTERFLIGDNGKKTIVTGFLSFRPEKISEIIKSLDLEQEQKQ